MQFQFVFGAEAEKRSPRVFVIISGVWIFNVTLQDSASFSPFRVRGNWDKVVRAKATSDCFAFPLTQLSIMRSCEVDLCFTAISISDRFEIRVWPARYGGVNTASS